MRSARQARTPGADAVPVGVSRLLVTSALLALGSCQHSDGRSLTEIGQVAIVSYEEPLCTGDALRIEELITHVEQTLAVTVTEPIPVFLYDHHDDMVERCWSGVAGCYTEGEVHTLWQALDHELVHAVDDSLGRPAPFWSEGMAEALGNRTRRGQSEVFSNLELEDERELDIVTAGHFVRWLLEEHGEAGLRKLAAEVPFASAYGFELADAIEDYEASAPWSYPDWNACRGAPLEPTARDAWDLDVEVDCTEPFSTVESSLGTGATRTVDIQRAGTYHLTLHGGRGLNLVACQLDVLDEPPDSDYLGDIVREEAGQVPPTQLASDQEHRLQLEPGRLLMYFSTSEGTEYERLRFELVRVGP